MSNLQEALQSAVQARQTEEVDVPEPEKMYTYAKMAERVRVDQGYLHVHTKPHLSRSKSIHKAAGYNLDTVLFVLPPDLSMKCGAAFAAHLFDRHPPTSLTDAEKRQQAAEVVAGAKEYSRQLLGEAKRGSGEHA